MKLAWPESQKRVLLKGGSMVFVPSSAGGSAALSGDVAAGCGGEDGASDCCAIAGIAWEAIAKAQSARVSQRPRSVRWLQVFISLTFPAKRCGRLSSAT